jgi:predicted ATPase/DNA-binding SARP family transcriptional activator
MAGLTLYLFGPPRLELAGADVRLDTRKAVALLAYLALTGQAHSRETLAALLFPEYDDDRAFANLRRTLWSLNKAGLGPYLDLGGTSVIALRPCSPATGLACDVDDFHRALAACAGHGHPADSVCPLCVPPLTQAADLYRGDLLAGFTLKDSAAFDEWQFFQAETLRREAAGALDRLGRGLAAGDEYATAIGYARRWLALDPLHEPAHRQLMRLYAASGQRAAALRQYQECVRVLADEVSAEPERETTALYEEIRHAPSISRAATMSRVLKAMRPPARPADHPLPAAGEPTPPPLPTWPTPFIGREPERARLAALLADPACRLLTLTGPGGIGKTRLALQAAADAQPTYAGRVYFVPLAALSSPDLIPGALAVALGLHPGDGARAEDDRKLPLDFLRGRCALLVMDNFEHLLAGADFLHALLEAAPDVKLLVTSRERLNAPSEWVFEVAGMAYPADGKAVSSPDGAAPTGDAADLFLQFARQARADFTPRAEDGTAIAAICRLLEGSPLGIELAAAWVRLLTPPEIAAEMATSLDFLESSQRGTPERQRSLRSAFDHSWRLLSTEERDVLRRLSIFQGGFTRAAAAAAAGAALPALAALVGNSLVHVVAPGRYDMHQVLKQYAAEKLAADPALQAETYTRHAAYYLEALADAEVGLQGPRQKAVLGELAVETENLRRAFETATDVSRLRAMTVAAVSAAVAPMQGNPLPDSILPDAISQGAIAQDAVSLHALSRAVPALILFYLMRARYREGDALVQPALARLESVAQAAPALPGLTEVLALLNACAAFVSLGFYPEERTSALFEAALTYAKRLPPNRARAQALMLLGFAAHSTPLAEAEMLYQETMAFCESTGYRWGAALARLRWADYPQPWTNGAPRAAAYEASLRDFTALGDRWSMALCYNGLTNIAFWVGDYSTAQGYARQSLDIYLAMEEPWRASDTRFYLAAIAMAQGAYEDARGYWQENLAFMRDMGRLDSEAVCLDCLASIDYLQGNFAAARRGYLVALDLHRRTHHRDSVAISLGSLGLAALALGHGTEARSCYQEALALTAQPFDDWRQAICFKNLGRLALRFGDLSAAADHLLRALAAALRSRRTPEALDILERLAQLWAECGEPERAVEALARSTDDPATPHDVRIEAEALLSRLEVQLAPENYRVARARGPSPPGQRADRL